jgi:hypothetical protein
MKHIDRVIFGLLGISLLVVSLGLLYICFFAFIENPILLAITAIAVIILYVIGLFIERKHLLI